MREENSFEGFFRERSFFHSIPSVVRAMRFMLEFCSSHFAKRERESARNADCRHNKALLLMICDTRHIVIAFVYLDRRPEQRQHIHNLIFMALWKVMMGAKNIIDEFFPSCERCWHVSFFCCSMLCRASKQRKMAPALVPGWMSNRELDSIATTTLNRTTQLGIETII
jgi:hypothetical protein